MASPDALDGWVEILKSFAGIWTGKLNARSLLGFSATLVLKDVLPSWEMV